MGTLMLGYGMGKLGPERSLGQRLSDEHDDESPKYLEVSLNQSLSYFARRKQSRRLIRSRRLTRTRRRRGGGGGDGPGGALRLFLLKRRVREESGGGEEYDIAEPVDPRRRLEWVGCHMRKVLE